MGLLPAGGVAIATFSFIEPAEHLRTRLRHWVRIPGPRGMHHGRDKIALSIDDLCLHRNADQIFTGWHCFLRRACGTLVKSCTLCAGVRFPVAPPTPSAGRANRRTRVKDSFDIRSLVGNHDSEPLIPTPALLTLAPLHSMPSGAAVAHQRSGGRERLLAAVLAAPQLRVLHSGIPTITTMGRLFAPEAHSTHA